MAEEDKEQDKDLDLATEEPGSLEAYPSPIGSLPKNENQALLIFFALLSSNMFALFIGFIFEFLSLRGVVDVAASRIALVWAWATGEVIVVVFAWGKGVRAKMTTSISSAALLAILLWGLDTWSPKPATLIQAYPLLAGFPVEWDSEKRVTAVALRLYVEDDPQHGPPRLSSLYNLHVVVARPIAVYPDVIGMPDYAAFASCIVVDARWAERNDDEDVLVTIPFAESLALEFNATARNGEWLGELLLRRHADQLEVEEWIFGAMTSPSGSAYRMLIHSFPSAKSSVHLDSKAKVEAELKRLQAPRTQRDRLISYGVPVLQLSKEQGHKSCGVGLTAVKELLGGMKGKTATLQHFNDK